MTVLFSTSGCKVNQYDTQTIREMLEHHGYTEFLPLPGAAPDVVIINSCTVTSESDRKARQAVSHFKKKYPDSVIVLTGCYPQAYFDAACAFGKADIVIGNALNYMLPELLKKYFEKTERIFLHNEHKPNDNISSMTAGKFEGHTRAFVKIEDGCNRFCSYCAIPYSRGRVRSKPVAALTAELRTLAASGYKEVVLAGINLTAYGTDFGSDLSEAVMAAAAVNGIERIRLGSMEPDQLTPEIIDKIAQTDKLCEQFHLSLQSGCDETLKRMKRHYDSEFYSRVVTRLREKFPGCSLTTDVMVGFPGETDEEFNQSLEFVRKTGFTRTHVFSYSRRSGTPAASMNSQILKSIKENRSHIMSQAAENSAAEFAANQLNTVASVLFERKYAENVWEGYTRNYILVHTESNENLSGEIRNVKLASVGKDFCQGILK